MTPLAQGLRLTSFGQGSRRHPSQADIPAEPESADNKISSAGKAVGKSAGSRTTANGKSGNDSAVYQTRLNAYSGTVCGSLGCRESKNLRQIRIPSRGELTLCPLHSEQSLEVSP